MFSGPVFVCGATGTQGGATARHLRNSDIAVHALVRDPSSTKAKKLEELGVTIFPGSFEDYTALAAALVGTQSAFLNFTPTFSDISLELRQAKSVLAAVKAAGVKHVVYTSSFGLDETQPTSPGLDPNGLAAQVYQVKKDITTAVISAGFDSYTIMRPAKFMSDLWGPASIWFGDLTKTGTFETALPEGVPEPWVDPQDIGAFGAAALLNPERFGGKKVDIFTEMLAIEEVIKGVAEVTGKKTGVRFLSEEEAEERKNAGDVFIQAQMMMRGMGQDASLEKVKSYGVPLSSYSDFLERQKKEILDTYSHLPGAE